MTNHYFKGLYKSKPEQTLIDDLMTESIFINGFEAYYIPNENANSRDLVYGDDPLKFFKRAYSIDVFIPYENIVSGTNNEFFSKFGVEIRNTIKATISRREFNNKIPNEQRPTEGNLLYVPFLSGTGELYEIKFVNDTFDKFTLGRSQPYVYEMELELFKYSHENIDVGIPDIDMIQLTDAYSINFNLGTGTGNYALKELVYQGTSSSNTTATALVADWNGVNKVLKVVNIVGNFNVNTAITGVLSNSSYILSNYEPLISQAIHDDFGNLELKTEVATFIDTNEGNPLGSLGVNK